jgi:uncharacterized protein YcfJ
LSRADIVAHRYAGVACFSPGLFHGFSRRRRFRGRSGACSIEQWQTRRWNTPQSRRPGKPIPQRPVRTTGFFIDDQAAGTSITRWAVRHDKASTMKHHTLAGMLAVSITMALSGCNQQAGASNVTTPYPPATNPAQPEYAQVVSVIPVQTSVTPRQVCHDEVITRSTPPSDQHQIAGTAIGAVAGGLLGNQVGHGKGRTLATVAGAVGGGYVGKEIEASHQQNQVSQSVVQRCQMVAGGNSVAGYDVTYLYQGVQHTTRMDHDPGNHVVVQQGVVVVAGAQ